jgi:preprotein translocase subunit SecA
MANFFKKILGIDSSLSFYENNKKKVEEINELEKEISQLTDISLRENSLNLKEKIKELKDLDNSLIESFALVREASKRVLKQRHFDVQLVCGIALHQRKVAEMKTGEGKTLASTTAIYLNALLGKGVHIVTVNDYLAKRDAVWMGQIYYALGLSVGCLAHDNAFVYDPDYNPEENKDEQRDTLGFFKIQYSYLRPVSRKEAYLADITYGTNHEFGFDYLRDNLVHNLEDKVQRPHFFAIIDEVDSILIDEARTPLIISAPEKESAESYNLFAKIAKQLKEEEDYEVDEKYKAVSLTDNGISKVEKILGIENIYNPEGYRYLHYLEESLKANILFKKDKDYVVKNNEVLIIDQFTGRILTGRRYSGGLHQAIEAKEGVIIKEENKILASITFQNYFLLYQKLSGMTGTALTSAEEFAKVYGLEVVSIPTNKPIVRNDLPDLIFKTEKEKWQAIIEEIKEKNEKGQPVLVGTISIEKNEYLSSLLNKEGISHEILNAKNHEREANIIAQAGSFKAITIATNMAGRGVDIALGGAMADKKEIERIKELGGLAVLGTERHEARRIDNQLRGRSGRMGDSGESRFFVSLEDDLMRIFGGEKLKNLMETFRFPDNLPIESKQITRMIESSQKRVEEMHFDNRRHIFEYDNVLNKHRTSFYNKRNEILKLAEEKKLDEHVKEIVSNNLDNLLELSDEMIDKILKVLEIVEQDFDISKIQENDKFNLLEQKTKNSIERIISQIGKEMFELSSKMLILQILDFLWVEHLENMEALRDSVRLRAYGQHDPLVEYKTGGHRLFKDFFIKFESIFFENIFRLKKPIMSVSPQPAKQVKILGNKDIGKKKIGRNEPCPCGSGKKYKKCCGE